MDYKTYRQSENESGVFRFTGSFESITDSHTLWLRAEGLTISVSLKKTQCWLLSMNEEGDSDALEQIRWNDVSTLSEGTKVFIGGCMEMIDGRLIFTSKKEMPLTVIFYNCPSENLTSEITRCARTRGEYWNMFTPMSIAIGALSLFYIAVSFLNRPAFHPTVIIALVLVFVPVLPVFPPGILLTILYRRMTWQARKYRAYFDLVRLPLRYLQPFKESVMLDNGETYGCIKLNKVPVNEDLPYLLPDIAKEIKKAQPHFFGILDENSALPVRSKDPFVSFGLLPDSPQKMSRKYALKAYSTEFFAWLILISGIAANIVFIMLILIQFQLLLF